MIVVYTSYSHGGYLLVTNAVGSLTQPWIQLDPTSSLQPWNLLEYLHSSRADVLATVSPGWQLAMVYYFTSNVVSPSAFIYVGKDKFESMQSTILARETS